MDMTIPPLKSNIMLESNPLKSRIIARRLAVAVARRGLAVLSPQPPHREDNYDNNDNSNSNDNNDKNDNNNDNNDNNDSMMTDRKL